MNPCWPFPRERKLDPELPTGEVLVSLDGEGIPSYDIVYPSAWDKIVISDAAILSVKESDAFIYGSLACREGVSENTLLSRLNHAPFKIFDVNLRDPFVDFSLINRIMQISDIIKMNYEELFRVAAFMGYASGSLTDNILFLSQKPGTNKVCVTRGKDGAVLFDGEQFYFNDGYKVKVEDTVGAGDSFLAGLIFRLLTTGDCDNALSFGCATGALVATHTGANPVIDKEEIEKIRIRN